MLAVKDGDFKELKRYKGNINDNILWYGGNFAPEQSLLSIASQNGHIDIVNYLIKQGATIDDQDDYGSTPLHYAARRGHLNVVQTLHNNGADINKKAMKQAVRLYGPNTKKITGTHETPLHYACHLGHLDVVQYLVSQNAKLDPIDYFDKTPKQKCEQGKWVPQTDGQKEVEAYLNQL